MAWLESRVRALQGLCLTLWLWESGFDQNRGGCRQTRSLQTVATLPLWCWWMSKGVVLHALVTMVDRQWMFAALQISHAADMAHSLWWVCVRVGVHVCVSPVFGG